MQNDWRTEYHYSIWLKQIIFLILKWLDAIAGICDLFTLKKSTIWYAEVIDVN